MFCGGKTLQHSVFTYGSSRIKLGRLLPPHPTAPARRNGWIEETFIQPASSMDFMDARAWRPTSVRTFARGVYRGLQNAGVYGVGAGVYDRIRSYVGGGAKQHHSYESYPWLSRTGGRRRPRYNANRMRYRNNPPRFYGRGYGRR